jgi:anti-sigma factor RsiW
MTDPFDSQSAIDRYFDDELDPAAFAQLQQWLEENPAAAAMFAEHDPCAKEIAR